MLPRMRWVGMKEAVLGALLIPAAAAAVDLTNFPVDTWVEIAPKWKYVPGIAGAFQERGWCTMRFRSAANSVVFYEGFGPSTRGNYCIYANSLYEYHAPKDSVEMLSLSNWYCNQGIPKEMPENQAAPTPMDRHTYSQFAYSPVDDRLYLAHGASGSMNHPHDLWAFNFSDRKWANMGAAPGGTQTWELVGESNLMFYPKTGELLLFKNRKSVYAYNVATKAWRTITPKGALNGVIGTHGGFDSKRNRFVFYGNGYTDNETGTNTFVWYEAEKETWVELAPEATWPPAKAYASVEYNTKCDVYMLHGGYNQNETWFYHPDGNRWYKVNAAKSTPLNGKQMTLVYDPANDVLINQVKGKMYLLRIKPEGLPVRPRQGALPGHGFLQGREGLENELVRLAPGTRVLIRDTRGTVVSDFRQPTSRAPIGSAPGLFFVQFGGTGQPSIPVLLSDQ